MVVGMAGSIGSGEKVVCERWFVGDSIGNVCLQRSRTWNLRFERVEKVHKPVDLVNPIVELWVFRGVSIFISRLLWSSGKAVGAMSSTGDMNEREVEQKDRHDPTIHAGGRGEVGIRQHTFNVSRIHLHN